MQEHLKTLLYPRMVFRTFTKIAVGYTAVLLPVTCLEGLNLGMAIVSINQAGVCYKPKKSGLAKAIALSNELMEGLRSRVG